MNVGIYGKKFSFELSSFVQLLISNLELRKCNLFIYEKYYLHIKDFVKLPKNIVIFNEYDDIKGKLDYLFSVGGDGTLLDSVTIIQDSNIPVVGINTGRLGFLSSIAKENIVSAINDLFEKKYSIDERTLIKIETDDEAYFKSMNYAMNEVSILKRKSSSMITVRVSINDVYLNTYWADGLLIATPTGSTGYSLSCGGPIVAPNSENFIITPVASHNLTVRPIVIPDKCEIAFNVEGRNMNYFIGLDSRMRKFDKSILFKVKKEDFKINLVKLQNETFFSTIRNKLMWGKDKRN